MIFFSYYSFLFRGSLHSEITSVVREVEVNMLTNTAFDAFLVATGATIYNLLVEHEELGLPPFESANLDVGTGATIAIDRLVSSGDTNSPFMSVGVSNFTYWVNSSRNFFSFQQ